MTKKKEMRTIDITNLQTRDGNDQEPIIISGYAAVFDSKTSIGDFFDELIKPGAFSRTITENGDIRALFNHNWDNVLGRTKNGTLTLEEDSKGLRFDLELPNTSLGRDLAESIRRGDINQCSFGFFATEETWDYNVEPVLRSISEVELYEISVVSIPAYEDTEVSLRSKEMDETVEKRIKLIQQINKTLGETK